MKRRRGWYGEPTRHAMSARGIASTRADLQRLLFRDGGMTPEGKRVLLAALEDYRAYLDEFIDYRGFPSLFDQSGGVKRPPTFDEDVALVDELIRKVEQMPVVVD
jgi:hypothetical protein